MNKICLIGSKGFISKNFLTQNKNKKLIISLINKKNIIRKISLLKKTNFLLHFAGTNRSKDKRDFKKSNVDLIYTIKKNIVDNTDIKIIYLSTNKINENSTYGKTKKKGEKLLVDFCKKKKITLYVYRLPNIFGKWSKPFYNSVVSTFCYSIMNNKNYINISPQKKIIFSHVDDLIKSINKLILKKKHLKKVQYINDYQKYKVSLKNLEEKIKSFKQIRNRKNFDIFKTSLDRKLYSTYISYCDERNFYYEIESNNDKRGNFIEFIKHKHVGQISYLTIKPNKVRGCHYHHYKTEKFLIPSGKFQVTYFDITDRNKKFTKKFQSKKSYVLETIPGYYHEIKNIGKEEIGVLIWANEIFNKSAPDTFKLNEKI